MVVVAGKGGVGKTTITAALAMMAAQAGLSVLIVELEGKPGLTAAFDLDGPLDYDERPLWPPGRVPAEGNGEDPATPGGTVRARRITPDDALLEYLADHGFHRVSKRLLSSGVIDVVATAIPGIRDVLVLGKVKQLERDQVADLILVDAPATGHAVTFLTSAQGLLDAARGGPVRAQAADVVEFLADPQRCRVMLVTLPEEMPTSETVEAAYLVEDRAGVRLGPLVVNACDPTPAALECTAAAAADAVGQALEPEQIEALEAARQFRRQRQTLQAEQLDRLARELPLPQLRTPELLTPSIGPDEVETLARALAEGVRRLPPE